MTEEKSSPTSLTYRDAGVDIDAGNALVERIKSVSQATHRSEVLNGLGGFGASVCHPSWLFRANLSVGYRWRGDQITPRHGVGHS